MYEEMSNPKWTPGPWRVGRGAQADPFAIEGPSHTIAHVKNGRYCEFDARLIASAPALYDALEALLIRYQADAGDNHPIVAQAQMVLKAASGDTTV